MRGVEREESNEETVVVAIGGRARDKRESVIKKKARWGLFENAAVNLVPPPGYVLSQLRDEKVGLVYFFQRNFYVRLRVEYV